MHQPNRQITLKHLIIQGDKMIGIKFFPDKVIQALIKELPDPKWINKYQMVAILNNRENLDLTFSIADTCLMKLNDQSNLGCVERIS